MTERFAGKVAVVTGAARGIGRGIALKLATDGADVVINDVGNAEDAAKTVADIEAMGRQGVFWQADVSDAGAIQAMMDGIVEKFGHLDIAVANAGMSIREPLLEAKPEHVQKTLNVTQMGVFHTCQSAAKKMVAQPLNGHARGKIVIIGSIHQEIPVAGSGAYNMAKVAVNHLGRTMAGELAAHKINVNVINPGWIRTPGELKFATHEQMDAAGQVIPWGRIGEPEDVANMAAFLCSDEADYITGASIRVDGGYMVGMELKGTP